jgi:hypothetical membrane protein
MISLLRQLLRLKLGLALTGMAAYVALEVWIGSLLSLWAPNLITDTVFWFTITGLAMFINLSAVTRKAHYFRNTLTATIGISAIAASFVDLFPLDFVGELVLIPCLLAASLTALVAQHHPESKSIFRFLRWLVAIAGLVLLVRVIVLLMLDWHGLDKPEVLRAVALPIWLVVGLLPYIYLLALLAEYGSAFLAVRFSTDSMQPLSLERKRVMVWGLGASLRRVAAFTAPWPARFASASSDLEARAIVAQYRRSLPSSPTTDGSS